MGRPKNATELGTPEPPTETKRYRTRSGSTKPWNTPAKNITEFEQITEDHADAGKTTVCSLKFRTSPDRVPLWINANKAHFNSSLEHETGYKFAWKNKDTQLSVTDLSKSADNNKVLTIHFYTTTGTVLIHGKGAKWYVDDIFPELKEAVNNAASASSGQNGRLDNEEPESRTIDNNTETMVPNSEDGSSAMMASDSNCHENQAKSDQTATDLTVEKENHAENTTPKSVASPTIRKVLGGLENIILSPFTKTRESTGKGKEAKSQQSNRSRRSLLSGNSPNDPPPSTGYTSAAAEAMYTTLVDEMNKLKTLVYNNKVTMDKQSRLIDDLQASLQNKKKVTEKQAQQLEKMEIELQEQRQTTKDLADRLSSRETDYETLQAQLLSLTNHTPCTDISAKPTDTSKESRKDDCRIQRLYSDVVSGQANSVDSTITSVPKRPASPAPQISAPVDNKSGENTTLPVTTESTCTTGPAGDKKDVRIFADSLWNDVNPDKMYRDKRSKIDKTTTLPKAIERIRMSPDTTTELVILHVGSNDMDNSKTRPDSIDVCVEQTRKLVQSAKAAYPNAKIAMSQVLPRGTDMRSKLNSNIATYNSVVEKTCCEDDQLIHVRHRLLSEDRSLYKPDGIHLRPGAGVSLMVADVKRTLRHYQGPGTDRHRMEPTRQNTKPVRKTPTLQNNKLHIQPPPMRPPFNPAGCQPPPFPWNPVPPPPPQWNNENQRAGATWSASQDKRHMAEKLVNMLTDFLRY